MITHIYVDIKLPIGNLNVLQIASILNNFMVNHVTVLLYMIVYLISLHFQENITQTQMIILQF